MPYRRHPQANRRYLHSETDAQFQNSMNNKKSSGESGRPISIPLPNETEIPAGSTPDSHKYSRSPGLFDFLRNRMRIEDIILLGLIFLLLEEGIDDEFLLILLVYILLG